MEGTAGQARHGSQAGARQILVFSGLAGENCGNDLRQMADLRDKAIVVFGRKLT